MKTRDELIASETALAQARVDFNKPHFAAIYSALSHPEVIAAVDAVREHGEQLVGPTANQELSRSAKSLVTLVDQFRQITKPKDQ